MAPDLTEFAFITAARAMHAEASAAKEAFVRLGLAEALLGELGQALSEFESMVNAFNAGGREHIGRKGVASHSLKLTGDFGMLASLENSFIRPQFGLRRWIAHLVHFLSN